MYKFYVIGNPISHSKSPLLFTHIFKILNINAVYKPLLIKNSHNYKTFIQDIHNTNILGFNITMPYKTLANEYLQTIEQKAQIIQSIKFDGMHFINFLPSLFCLICSCLIIFKSKRLGNGHK